MGMEVIIQIVVMGFLVEAVWENLKMIWQNGHIEFDKVGALLVGLIIAFTIQVDIFLVIGLDPLIPFVGVVATGILISRGGNYIHDLFQRLKDPKETDDNWRG